MYEITKSPSKEIKIILRACDKHPNSIFIESRIGVIRDEMLLCTSCLLNKEPDREPCPICKEGMELGYNFRTGKSKLKCQYHGFPEEIKVEKLVVKSIETVVEPAKPVRYALRYHNSLRLVNRPSFKISDVKYKTIETSNGTYLSVKKLEDAILLQKRSDTVGSFCNVILDTGDLDKFIKFNDVIVDTGIPNTSKRAKE